MTAKIRSAIATDAEACGRIIFDAFKGIAEQHGFPRDFPSVEAATQLATTFIADPSVYGVVAEMDGRVVGSNFLTEGDPIRGVGPVTVDPTVPRWRNWAAAHGGGPEKARGAIGVRLVQDAFNTRSIALYASVGFDVKEALLLMGGTPRSKPSSGFSVRPMTGDDVSACAKLCMAVHGIERTGELRAMMCPS